MHVWRVILEQVAGVAVQRFAADNFWSWSGTVDQDLDKCNAEVKREVTLWRYAEYETIASSSRNHGNYNLFKIYSGMI